MPELCDVEGYRRYFRRHATGRALRDRVFTAPGRRGKWLLAPTDDAVVVVMHFGMTGGLERAPDAGDRHPHDRVVLMLDDGSACGVAFDVHTAGRLTRPCA